MTDEPSINLRDYNPRSMHTPGPWETQPNPRIYGHSFVVPEGYLDDIEGLHTICHTSVKDADAHLIAAAPDMLDALAKVTADDAFRQLSTSTRQKLMTAIAKAIAWPPA